MALTSVDEAFIKTTEASVNLTVLAVELTKVAWLALAIICMSDIFSFPYLFSLRVLFSNYLTSISHTVK